MILLKVTTTNNVWFVTIVFVIMGPNTKIILDIGDIAIIFDKKVDYCCIIIKLCPGKLRVNKTNIDRLLA